MKNILIVPPVANKEFEQRTKKAAEGNNIRYLSPIDVKEEDISWANILIGNVAPGLLHGQELEFCQLTSAGADAYVKESVLNRNTVLSCCTGAYSQTVAEHALAMTLMLIKDLHTYRDAQLRSEWIAGGAVGSINGATVIIMGLGDIGCYYAKMAKALGAYVIGVKRRKTDKPEYIDELYTTDKFDEIACRGDIIFSVLPSTAETVHYYTRERFEKMKPGAVFINCGRGTAVSADVLYEVLSENIITAAGIDVFETEPLPAESPLWQLKNLVVTPHASGFFHLPSTITNVTDICVYNLDAWLNGKDLRNVVDYNTGYKK